MITDLLLTGILEIIWKRDAILRAWSGLGLIDFVLKMISTKNKKPQKQILRAKAPSLFVTFRATNNQILRSVRGFSRRVEWHRVGIVGGPGFCVSFNAPPANHRDTEAQRKQRKQRS